MSDEKKQLSKARQALVDRVLSRLDADAMPWDNGMQGSFERPRNAVTGKQYSGINVLNLMLAFKSDPRWLTFNQAKDNGYSVKKGAKGVPIELYKTIDKRTGKDADFDAIREEIKDMTFTERQEFKKENLQSFARSYYVFNASDVAGIEPYRAKELTLTDISARNARIERIITDSQAPIFYDGNGENFYNPKTDEIHLTDWSAFKSNERFYNTALHEMAHSTSHSSRLNRPIGTFGTQAYAREELVAEISSVLTATELGLNYSDRTIDNSAEYVRGWAQLIHNNPQVLIDAAFDASKATDYICDAEYQRELSKEKNLQSNVKEWYTRTFPSDERGAELNANITFDDVNNAIINKLDIYTVLGVDDNDGSEVRERVFDGLSYILCTSRHEVYERWLNNYLVLGENSTTADEYKAYATICENTPQDKKYVNAEWVAKTADVDIQVIWDIVARYDLAIINGEFEVTSDMRKSYDFLKEQKEETQKESLQANIKEWYAKAYPTDDLKDDIKNGVTFGTARDAIRTGKDIYGVLGVDDSIVRERVFHKLADVLDVPYKAVYNSWIENSESAETRRERQRQVAMQDYPKDFADDGLIDVADDFARHTPNSGASKEPPKERQHTKPLIVNFYAGPSCGKTIAALELTAALKKVGYNVEYVSEYAKELVLEKKLDLLKDQQHVTDMQYKWLDRLRNAVDVIVTDSPVLLGLVYGEINGISDEYKKQIRSYYDSFDNFNMLITRPKDATFQTEGRIHDEKQSIELDGKIKSMLDTQGVFYGSYKRDDIAKTVERISTTYNRLYGNEKQKRTQKESAPSTPSAPNTSHMLKTDINHIPDTMKALPNWVAFRTETVDGKVKKILLSPNKGASEVQYLKWAKSDDPTTWATFDKAVAFAKKYKLDGLAFSMSGSGMTCIDLDHHLDEHGNPSELAQKYIAAADNTYIEKSVSGRGLHIFYAGSRPSDRQNRNIGLDLEVYDDRRFISMTGNYNGCDEVSAPSAELDNLLKSNLAKIQQYSAPSMPLGMDDNALINKIRNSKVGRDFDALWSGSDICGDHSVSDFKLCNMLAFFSGGDAAQVERVFRSSGLYRPQKGDAYVKRTAEKACATLTKTFIPQKPKSHNKPSGNGAHSSSGR